MLTCGQHLGVLSQQELGCPRAGFELFDNRQHDLLGTTHVDRECFRFHLDRARVWSVLERLTWKWIASLAFSPLHRMCTSLHENAGTVPPETDGGSYEPDHSSAWEETPMTVISHLLDQLSWRNAERSRQLPKRFCRGDIVRVFEHAFDRVISDIRISLQFAHTEAFLSGNFFHA